MKKFLPAFILFGIVFTGTIALQVGTSTLNAATTSKAKTKNEFYEELFSKLSVETITGKKIEAKKIKSSVVMVNFWASWCLPCMEEMPSLVNLKKQYKDSELTVLSLNTDENDQQKNIIKTLKKFNITNEFEVVADKNTKIADTFKFSAIPVTIIFKSGKVVDFTNGPVDFNAAEFKEKMNKWIKN